MVRLVDSFQPDMVIMEVILPDMSGVETGLHDQGNQSPDPGGSLFPLFPLPATFPVGAPMILW